MAENLKMSNEFARRYSNVTFNVPNKENIGALTKSGVGLELRTDILIRSPVVLDCNFVLMWMLHLLFCVLMFQFDH